MQAHHHGLFRHRLESSDILKTDMDLGLQIGKIIGTLLFPVLVIAVVGLIQFIRTKDIQTAIKSMMSTKTIGLAVLLLMLGIIGRAVQLPV